MTRLSGNSWTPNESRESYDTPTQPNGDIGSNQQGKPIKTVIGIAVLVVLALVLSRMNPVPHDTANAPSITTGQAVDANAR